MNISNWKAQTTNSVVPTNSRPFFNGDPNLNSIPRVAFKANPIKHWRKQLKPYYATNSKQVSINSIDAPSSVNYIKDTTTDCSVSNYQLLKENVDILNECNGIRLTDGSCTGGTNHVTRAANTNINRSYHTSHSQYLQRKCKTYERNQHIGKKVDGKDNTFYSSSCSLLNSTECNKEVIYKPSNSAFHTQGAVSASAATLRRKNKALTQNTKSLKTAYGTAPVHMYTYYAGETGYSIRYVKGDTENPVLCSQTFKSCR